MNPVPGQTISHYRILEYLGGGGMGVVYKAEDLKLKRAVAIKFLPPELTRDAPSRRRFMHEAQAASGLEHNNVCTVYEIGEAPDGQIFIVMAYYDGVTLGRKLEGGALPIGEGLSIALQVCQGLVKVHERGVVHRDIKPANVMITGDGDAKIVDFGLARLAGRTVLTMAGSTLGTAAYMSPEQALGSDADQRSDLFSLGVVMYEMFTGRRPFVGEHEQALIYSIQHAAPPPPTTINRSIPAEVEAVILRLLDKSPANRYQTAQELRSDLLRLTGSAGGTATVPIRVQPYGRWKTYGLAGIILVVAVIAWSLYPSSKPAPPPVKPPWRIGIVPFGLLTRRPEAADWPMVIQMILVDHLNGIEELRVIDPFSLSGQSGASVAGSPGILISSGPAGASYLVNGTIEWLDTAYVIRCTLTDVADRSVKMSDEESARSEKDISRAVEHLSEQILAYFQIQTLSESGRVREDLAPWLNHRTKNLDAIKAFLQGAQFRLRWQPGGEKYFRKAVELDSTFVTARTWLISGLVNGGHLAEARAHQAYLMRHMFSAGPFEQALIRWTGAMIDGNLQGQATALEEALEYSPQNNVLLYLLGDLRYGQEDYAAAVSTIRPAVESGWNFQPASLLLGSSLFQLRRYAESRKVLEYSLGLETLVPETYAILSALALHDDDSATSETYAQEFFRRTRNEGAAPDSVYGMIADDCAFLGLYKPASVYYAKAVSLNPGRSHYSLGAARSALETGNLEGAQGAAARALHLDPGLTEAHEILGRVYEQQRDTAAAIREFTSYLAKDSTSAVAAEVRGRTNGLVRQ